jgi:hypothetical protein
MSSISMALAAWSKIASAACTRTDGGVLASITVLSRQAATAWLGRGNRRCHRHPLRYLRQPEATGGTDRCLAGGTAWWPSGTACRALSR